MNLLLAWGWVPVLVYVIVLGVGLVADRVLGAELPPAVLAPTGLAVTVVVTTLGYRLGPPGLVGVAVLVLSAAGFFLARKGLRERVWAPSAFIAGVVVYGLYMAPIVLSGQATWSGYNFVNDTASNFLLIDWLGKHGVATPADVTGAANTVRNLVESGYPLGSFSVVAALRPFMGATLESVYQPVMSVFAAFGAMSLTEVARRAGLRPAAAVVAATLPFGGVLLYRYVLHGAIKEIAVVTLACTAVALASVALDRQLAIRPVVLVAVVCLAMVLVFSAAAAGFALALGGGTLIAAALLPERPSLGHVAKLMGVALAVAFLAVLPLLGSVLQFAHTIRAVFASSGGAASGALGQLVRPLPVTEAAGVWIGRDYRVPADGPLNAQLVAAAIIVAAAGLFYCLWKRRFGPVLLVLVMVIPALVLSPMSSTYIDGKLLVLCTPAAVFVGAFGALSALQAMRRPVRIVGAVALVAVAAGVLMSDAYSYRDAHLAPTARVNAMKDIAAHVPDRGLYMLNEWEEYGKYFMSSARVNPASESESVRPVQLREPAPIFGQWFDLDLQQLTYVDGFAGIIMRRSPAASRPPADFRLLYHNRYYELWHRGKAVRVRDHLAFQSPDRATGIADCRAVRRLKRRARPGDRLIGAMRPRVARLSPLQVRHPRNWPKSGEAIGTLTTHGAGTLRGTLTGSGRQRVWLRASAPRALKVSIDGHAVGRAHQIGSPGQWIQVGSVSLASGAHRIEIRRGSATLRPGDSFDGYLGDVALEAVGPSRLEAVAPRDAARLCGRPFDWIELVGRPR